MTSIDAELTLWPSTGFLVLREVLDLSRVEQLRALLDEHRIRIPPSREILYPNRSAVGSPSATGMSGLMEQWLNPHLRRPELSTCPIADSIRGRIRDLLQSEPVLFQDLLMSKNPGHRVFPLHQDFPFWPVLEPEGGILWTALDPIDAASGGLGMARGSHLSGLGPPIDLHTGRPQQGGTTNGMELDRIKLTVEIPELETGDAIWFHPLLWHCSGINTTGRQRRVWTSSWLPAHARWCRARAPRHPFASRLPDGAAVGEHGWTPLLAVAGDAL